VSVLNVTWLLAGDGIGLTPLMRCLAWPALHLGWIAAGGGSAEPAPAMAHFAAAHAAISRAASCAHSISGMPSSTWYSASIRMSPKPYWQAASAARSPCARSGAGHADASTDVMYLSTSACRELCVQSHTHGSVSELRHKPSAEASQS
jgi:hypothetical protein